MTGVICFNNNCKHSLNGYICTYEGELRLDSSGKCKTYENKESQELNGLTRRYYGKQEDQGTKKEDQGL